MVARLGGTIPETAAVLGWEGLMEIDPDIIFVVDSYQDAEQARRGIYGHPFARNLPGGGGGARVCRALGMCLLQQIADCGRLAVACGRHVPRLAGRNTTTRGIFETEKR